MTYTKGNLVTNVKTGPSGRAMAHPMDPSILDALHQHINMERAASAQYFAMSIWCSEREFKGFSNFFNKESQNEQVHATNFANYLIARGQNVALLDLSAPNQDWTNIEDLFSYSFQMEADVTASLNQIYSMAERSSDTRTTVFLDPTIEGQTASEDEFAYLLGKLKLANNDPSALFIIDSELNK